MTVEYEAAAEIRDVIDVALRQASERLADRLPPLRERAAIAALARLAEPLPIAGTPDVWSAETLASLRRTATVRAAIAVEYADALVARLEAKPS